MTTTIEVTASIDEDGDLIIQAPRLEAGQTARVEFGQPDLHVEVTVGDEELSVELETAADGPVDLAW